jgi:hypothetical protein
MGNEFGNTDLIILPTPNNKFSVEKSKVKFDLILDPQLIYANILVIKLCLRKKLIRKNRFIDYYFVFIFVFFNIKKNKIHID